MRGEDFRNEVRCFGCSPVMLLSNSAIKIAFSGWMQFINLPYSEVSNFCGRSLTLLNSSVSTGLIRWLSSSFKDHESKVNPD